MFLNNNAPDSESCSHKRPSLNFHVSYNHFCHSPHVGPLVYSIIAGNERVIVLHLHVTVQGVKEPNFISAPHPSDGISSDGLVC